MSKKDIFSTNSHFGVNDYDFWFHLRPLEETKLLFDYGSKLLSDLGIYWDRVHLPGIFSWNVIEPIKGKYDWTIPDTLVKVAQKYDVHLLPNIWPFTAWDQKAWSNIYKKRIGVSLAGGKEWSVDNSYPIPPRYDTPHDLEAYSKWISAMVERYDGDGIDDMPGLKYPIKYWEPANDPSVFSLSSARENNHFTEMTKLAYLAAKKADPDTQIILGACGDYFSMKNLFKEVLDLGKNDNQHYFDILQLQLPGADLYIDSQGADKMLDKGILQNIQSVKTLLTEYNHTVPIWITEFGTHVSDQQLSTKKTEQQLKNSSSLPIQSEQDQAIYFIKGVTMAFEKGVERIFWQGLGPIRPPNKKLTNPIPESFPGYSQCCLLDTKGKPRIIYHVLRLFTKLLNNFETVKKIDFGEDIEAYDYCNGFQIIWSDTDKNLTLKRLNVDYLMVVTTIPKIYNTIKDSQNLENAIEFDTRLVKVTNEQATIKITSIPVIIGTKI